MGFFSNGLEVGLYLLLARLLVLFITMPVHETAHGWAAYKLGDDTANRQGRLTLNPFAHLDWAGTALILLTGFGWAKPVPVNPARFDRKISMRAGMALTAAAGPLSNILLAWVLLLVKKLMLYTLAMMGVSEGILPTIYILAQIFQMMISINVGLAVFNLLPIPPLDGYNILQFFVPAKWIHKIMQYEQYFFFIVFALVTTSILDGPIYFLRGWVMRLLEFSTQWVDLLFQVIA